MPETNDDANKRLGSYHKIALFLVGDNLDIALSTVLEAIGEAIGASIERIDTIKRRYGKDAADMAAEDEIPVIEDFLGLAFVVCQNYISNVVTELRNLHAHARQWNNADLTTTSGLREDMMRYGFRPTKKRPYSRIEVLHAYANYYKHRDEWDFGWKNLNPRAQQTAAIISAAGATPSSTGNLREGARFLGNRKFMDVAVFMKIFSEWRKKLVWDYKMEIRGQNLK